jgi:hypothetical protein
MKRFLTICSVVTVLALAVNANAQQRYGWTVSGSPTNPCQTTGNVSGVASIYLWYCYNSPDGVSAADISVVVNPAGSALPLAFVTANGFLNAGGPSNLLLAVGGCPDGPILAGNWLAQVILPSFEWCLGGLNSSVNCDINPLLFPNDHHGFGNGGFVVACVSGMDENCQPTTAVESSSWGSWPTWRATARSTTISWRCAR